MIDCYVKYWGGRGECVGDVLSVVFLGIGVGVCGRRLIIMIIMK